MEPPRRPVLALMAALTTAALGLAGVAGSSGVAAQASSATTAARALDPTFRVATFNVLGASHTVRGRQKYMGPGVRRMGRAVRIIDRRHIGLVGFQEMQGVQVREFQRLRGSSWGLYPGTALRELDGENSIGWRQDTWRLIKASTVPIPYFKGHIRNMPLLLMQNRATGRHVYVLDVHNPATNRRVGNQDRWRHLALAQETALINNLRLTTHLPVIFVGDFNDRALAFCPLYRDTSLRSASGGSATSTSCTMTAPTPVDWVFGSIGVDFTGYRRVDTPYVRRTTDHPVVLADVRLAAPSAIIAP